MPHGGLTKLPNEISIRAAGLPRVLRTVEDALSMIEHCRRSLHSFHDGTSPRRSFSEALKSQKSRDLKTAARQLEQAISNERWS